MTLPPPQDPYGPPPQGGGAPSWGGQPAGYGGQYGGPPPQGPPPQWGQQPQWNGPPGPPPSKGGRGKWILGGLAVLVVVALAVVITVLVVRPSSGGTTPTPTNANSDFASANDTGPVNIIAEDPTCEAWGRVLRDYSGQQKAVNWGERDRSIAASAWTSEQRSMYEAVGKATTNATDLTVNLAKQTPHRVMRELYEQFIAYGHAFVTSIPTYVIEDDELSNATNAIGTGLSQICSAIDFKSAPPLAPLIKNPAEPSGVAPLADPTAPERFLTEENPVCSQWLSLGVKYNDDTATWRALDPNVPASQWTPEQRSVNDAVASVMTTNSDDLERLGRQSGNSVLEDVAVLAAQYQRAFVTALPGYVVADNFLSEAATYLVKSVEFACKAAR
jgi:hypothetical protein